MNSRPRRLGGVLGGMGPVATVDFLRKVIALTQAKTDQEHVPLIVHQVPQIPDRSGAIAQNSDAPLAPMLEGLRRLARAGAEYAVIPCNTAHHWYPILADAQPLRLLHIADAVEAELQLRNRSTDRLALLGTRGLLRSGFYADRLKPRGTRFVAISETLQTLVDLAIEAVKSGNSPSATKHARIAVQEAQRSGAEIVVLACTELPVALAECAVLEDCIDSTLALARSCVVHSFAGDSCPVAGAEI